MSANPDEDLFKPAFKYYKGKAPTPNFNRVIDIHELKNMEGKCHCISPLDGLRNDPSLIDSIDWKVYRMDNGLFLLQNPFKSYGLSYWITRCVKDFSMERNNIASVEGWFMAAQNDCKLVDKLRWSTLGYHHDWDTKVYGEKSLSAFPRDLAKLAQTILTYIGHPDGPAYKAEAAIVNYYPMDSTLSGHVDFSEPNKSAPLVSVSFGQSAIFLIGGPTKATKPDAIMVRNGDVLVMTQAARQSYHAVPRIVKSDLELGLGLEPDFIKKYVSSHRINMNVRQVF